MDSFRNLEDETFPSFLYNTSLGGSGCATLGNVTLGSTLGVPMAASTVAKIRATIANSQCHDIVIVNNNFIACVFCKMLLCIYFCVFSSSQGGFCMPDVRLAATGMDSCPASDEEDTEDELEASQTRSRARFLLPSTSRQLVGESHRPHFRPGLEGGSSDDETQPDAQFPDSRTSIEHRHSAEGQVIDIPITGEVEPSAQSSGPAILSPVNWSMNQGRQEWWSLICIFTSVFNADAGHSVVYQNEEGKWVTDLAYYSSFEKEVGTDVQENISVQSEDFVGDQAMEKIIEDQNEFEKEHQFIQEEKIEAANASMVLKDTSWKVPSSSHILMRASQASTEFEKGNQSYLRISLGEFFQQRSEALGCLGSSEEDFVKRPSFGYVINSPEKREPFALLRPSDFCSRGNSVHSETVQLSDNELPLNSAHSSMSSSNSGSSLSLSISTIASAIADASISSDPAQLAAMIMELSKKSRSRSSQQTGLSTQLSGAKMLPGQSNIQDALQKTSSLVDLSLDMEKYLKKAELSSSDSDASSSQSCLDILSLADSLTRSQRLEQRQSPPLQNETSAHTESTGTGQSLTSSSSLKPKPLQSGSGTGRSKSECHTAATAGCRSSSETKVKVGTAQVQVSGTRHSLKSNDSLSHPPAATKTSPSFRSGGRSGLSSLKSSPHTPQTKSCLRQTNTEEVRAQKSPQAPQSVGKDKQALVRQNSEKTQDKFGNHCSFRPSTSPLTHSSPSQTSLPSAYEEISSPSSSGGVGERSPGADPLSPQSQCFSPSLSRLTYLSINENTVLPTPDHHNVSIKSAQVVVPDELKFPNSCCVGIACQTSLSIFNPSERWQQVAISIVNLSIDGHKVDSLPYQWLIVKNKTIIGPKSTEEQKVLLIAPKAGLYQCTLSVSSWPASAESETVAQAEVFAKKVVLVAVAENPAIEVDVGKTGCLDFGDLAGGSVKALPLKLVNRTRATVPIRLVISANASAWHCFSFSKSPVAMTPDGTQLSGANLMPVSAPSVINHVMHSSYGDNPDSFMVWVHFNAPQRFSTNSGELGQPDEYSARVDIEVDSPGPSHVIQSVALKARSGTARVHAPKDLQTVCLQSSVGQTARQNLPLKNAGNIDVQLRLKCNDGDDCFIVKPEEFFLRTGEEKSVVVAYTAQGSRKFSESVLTILVLPSGPQYEVVLKGEVIQGNSAKVSSTLGSVPHSEVPPILSNKQFMAWGGVTLGRAVQQKLVLRNNSPTASQQLRLLIRGQDQDCFQLQSSFGPDERLTRNRELLIKPKEDMTVHLLFAPTRVASMLAKLEIKQSALRPSQPGVKFTIPLSGYGGTSNVILEELRKRSDGYVATLSGIQAGHVSKLCVCVRNTGSRAAFVRAVPYSDLEKRTVMESTVISLSPSQFVLKERTQEVITVVMKASRREQALCQSNTALLATVCLFCGDEVSRQQFRKLLSIKPDAGKKVLSENSLLRNISFDEPFLGEELVQESHDLPQRPNEGQIFYGNMSKVMLSLFGTVEMSDSGESDLVEFVRPSHGLGTSERQFSNVSLDVLPVKGPPLCISEPVLKRTEPPVDNTWGIQPEQLVLAAPTINGAADTRHVQIINRSSRELSFELSWPAHCLTITPQHGVIEPQSHLQILISPNPSLATRTSMLPWNGQIYVQCDNQQKFIRVQIRQDLALDVSAAGPPSEQSLCPLPPQAETPTGPGLKAQISSPQHQVLIKDRTLVFPSTLSGESSECSLEMENSGEEVRWYLSSFAPPYVKGVDGSGDVYRATYSAFRCERVSGMLGVKEKMQVPFTFLPRDGGDYAQFWDLECHPVSKPQHKSCIRFQLCGTVSAELSHKDECTLVRTETNVKSKKRVENAGSKTGAEPSRRGVYVPQSLYTFPATRVGEVSTLKVNFRNNSSSTHELRFLSPTEPFYIKHSKYSLRTQHYINLPVQFKPAAVGQFSGMLHVQTDTDVKLSVELAGEALP
uniref:Centrosomal protein 192 n=1 Tax=Astyanax mexicanus TaxID=7994 RepID=A0A8B9KIB4_ASTMX